MVLTLGGTIQARNFQVYQMVLLLRSRARDTWGLGGREDFSMVSPYGAMIDERALPSNPALSMGFPEFR
jgi:hypothetical protein